MDNQNKREIPETDPQRRPEEVPQQKPQEVPEINNSEKSGNGQKESGQKKWSDISDPEIGEGVC